MHSIDFNRTTPCFSPKCVLVNAQKILLVSAVVLGMIGLLAALKAPGLTMLTPFWSCFSLAGLVLFIIERFYCEKLCYRPFAEPFSLPQEPEDLFVLGRKCENEAKEGKAFLCYLIATSRGHEEASFYLAQFYAQGKGISKPNIPLAIAHFKVLAASGHYESILYLARLYLDQNRHEKAIQTLRTVEDKWSRAIEIFEEDCQMNSKLASIVLRAALISELRKCSKPQ